MPAEKFRELPKAPGVYAFFKGKQILYIGKAGNLKDRVTTHFTQPSWRDNLFVDEVEKIGYLKTESDIDALLMESALIKKVQPKYNVMWKDDKNYFFVAITKNGLPCVTLTHRPVLKAQEKKGERTEYLGPFTEGKSIKRALSFLRRVFPYYAVKKHGKLPCPWCHLNLCPGPNPDEKAYKKDIAMLTAVLKGKKTFVQRQLEKEMKEAAKREDYERAASYRDQFLALGRVISHAKLLLKEPDTVSWESIEPQLQKLLKTKKRISRIEAYDISNTQGLEATGSQVTFLKGLPAKESYRKYKIQWRPGRSTTPRRGGLGARARQTQAVVSGPNDFAMMQELVSRRLTHREWPYPQVMVIDGGKGQLSSAKKALDASQVKNIILVSLAKREEELFFVGKPASVRVRDLPRSVENLFLAIRDEAHRFAISYHRHLRSKAMIRNA